MNTLKKPPKMQKTPSFTRKLDELLKKTGVKGDQNYNELDSPDITSERLKAINRNDKRINLDF